LACGRLTPPACDVNKLTFLKLASP